MNALFFIQEQNAINLWQEQTDDVKLSRKLNVDPELALRESNTKFIKRFSFIESAINNNGENINFVQLDKAKGVSESPMSFTKCGSAPPKLSAI